MLEKAHLTPEEAKKIFDSTRENIKEWKTKTTDIKQGIYDLLKGNAHIALGLGNKDLFDELADSSTLHRSTLYDYKNAALTEIELNIEHGKMSTDALVTLREETKKIEHIDEDTNVSIKEIYNIAKSFCESQRKYPVKAMILKAAEKYKLENVSAIFTVCNNNLDEAPTNNAGKRENNSKETAIDINVYMNRQSLNENFMKQRKQQADDAQARVQHYTKEDAIRFLSLIDFNHAVDNDLMAICTYYGGTYLSQFIEELKTSTPSKRYISN